MTTDIETQQEKIEIYYRKLDTWANSTVRAGTVVGIVAGFIAGVLISFNPVISSFDIFAVVTGVAGFGDNVGASAVVVSIAVAFLVATAVAAVAAAVTVSTGASAVAIAIAIAGTYAVAGAYAVVSVLVLALAVAYAYAVAGAYAATVAYAYAVTVAVVFWVYMLLFIVSFFAVGASTVFVYAVVVFIIVDYLSDVAVRRVYAIIVDHVPGKFIVYTDAKAEQFFIDTMNASDITIAIQEHPDLKIIEQGGSSGLSIISGKLADFPYAKKIIDSEDIAKGDNLSAKWDSIKEAMVELAKERSGSDEGKNDTSFINEALEVAGSPVFCQASKAGSALEIGHFKIRNFMLAKISKTIVPLSIFLGISLSVLVLSVVLFFVFLYVEVDMWAPL